ncbi:MAG: tRNA uridine-5-carboxymethylaminomethyl(34) synthesis GTPase MnmE [Pseudomonadales bacterium]|nr:tRNA uridine-5-carboxymethylaminomethyl(34) synthesis GTPase MnmE [Pseudomonadales bacterium]
MNDSVRALDNDTIAAQATPPGRGGVGIVRISGPKANVIARTLCKRNLPFEPRYAHFARFHDAEGRVLDEGLVLFFPGPNSFTGEDVVELQGHGGPVVMASLLNQVVDLGARVARPGEFSERAFLNDKIDLAQAEAIADLIDSSSEQAARSALRSLQGAFSDQIGTLVEQVIALRMYVEAAIDFPEEEIDFLADGKVLTDLDAIIEQLDQVFQAANRGVLMKEGMKVVLAGKPNAGKSSLLNALSGRDSAIVTSVAGTTRDVLREHIHLDGMPLHITDTAGLRESPDEVEQEGIRRAWQEINQADRVIMLVDATSIQGDDYTPRVLWPEFVEQLPKATPLTVVLNKIDLVDGVGALDQRGTTVIPLSAKTGAGVDLLREHLKSVMGYRGESQGSFTARQRHIEALKKAQQALHQGRDQLVGAGAGELLAEDLRLTQEHLGEITGRFTPDDLLGRIFSSFCIGK